MYGAVCQALLPGFRSEQVWLNRIGVFASRARSVCEAHRPAMSCSHTPAPTPADGGVHSHTPAPTPADGGVHDSFGTAASSGGRVVLRFTKCTYSYRHVQQHNGWVRCEKLELFAVTSAHGSSKGVNFTTQNGRISGIHGDWSFSPDTETLVVCFSWKGTKGVSRRWVFNDGTCVCGHDRRYIKLELIEDVELLCFQALQCW
jgi:hypothetical protein